GRAPPPTTAPTPSRPSSPHVSSRFPRHGATRRCPRVTLEPGPYANLTRRIGSRQVTLSPHRDVAPPRRAHEAPAGSGRTPPTWSPSLGSWAPPSSRAARRSRRTSKQLPFPRLDRSRSSPPCCSTRRRHTVRPTPTPPAPLKP